MSSKISDSDVRRNKVKQLVENITPYVKDVLSGLVEGMRHYHDECENINYYFWSLTGFIILIEKITEFYSETTHPDFLMTYTERYLADEDVIDWLLTKTPQCAWKSILSVILTRPPSPAGIDGLFTWSNFGTIDTIGYGWEKKETQHESEI